MELFESSLFTKYVSAYLSEEDYRSLQNYLVFNPEAGDLIQGTGGFRKLRWIDSSRGKGKRGGTRIIYYYFDQHQQIWLMTIYNKTEASDLTPAEKKTLKAAIEQEKKLKLEQKVKPIKRKK